MSSSSLPKSLKDAASKDQKLIQVNSSSIVDLKAELLRKREEVRQRILSTVSSSKKSETNDNNLYSDAIQRNIKLPKRILESAQKQQEESNQNKRLKGQLFKKESQSEEHNEEQERALEQSRTNLERKAKLYEQIIKGMITVDDDDENILVNFQQKQSMVNTYESEEPEEKQEDLVEYVDLFGRTRMVTQSEFERLERERLEEEKEEEKTSDFQTEASKAKNIYYQHVREGEVRDHGVAFYSFSEDEQTRAKQMETLEKFRKETEAKKMEKRRIKEKRKQMLRSRLEKVANRKGITLPEEAEEDNEEDQDQMIRLEKATLMKDLPKSSGPREWDLGKEGLKQEDVYKSRIANQSPFYSQDKYEEKLRKERNPEFAPPQSYFGKDDHSIKKKKDNSKPVQNPETSKNNLDINTFISEIRKNSYTFL